MPNARAESADIVAALAFLSSDEAAYITGRVLSVRGISVSNWLLDEIVNRLGSRVEDRLPPISQGGCKIRLANDLMGELSL